MPDDDLETRRFEHEKQMNEALAAYRLLELKQTRELEIRRMDLDAETRLKIAEINARS